MALIKQATQSGSNNRLRRTAKLALRRSIVFLLVLTQQSFGCGVCQCNLRSSAEHPDFYQPRYSVLMVSAQRENINHLFPHHCTSKVEPVLSCKDRSAEQCDQLTQRVGIYCQAGSPVVAEAFSVAPTSDLSLINALPPTTLGAQINATPTLFTIHASHHIRPLYLYFSSLLI